MVSSTRTTALNKTPLSIVEAKRKPRQINNLPKIRKDIEKLSLWGEVGQSHFLGYNQSSINLKKKLISKSIKKCVPPILQTDFNSDLKALINLYDKELFDLRKAIAALISLRDINLNRTMEMLKNQRTISNDPGGSIRRKDGSENALLLGTNFHQYVYERQFYDI